MSGAQNPTLQEAFALYQQGRIAQAQAVCDVLLQLKPRDAAVLHLSGLMAFQGGDAARAVERLVASVAANPNDATAFNTYTAALVARGDFDAALQAGERSIALRAGYASAYNNRGNALKGLKRNAEAAASYRQAIAFNPGLADAHNNLGAALTDLGDFDRAIASIDQALALNPGFARAHSNRGVALRKSKRPDLALACFDQAIAVEPDNAELHHGRGTILCDLKRFRAAADSFSAAIALRPGFADAALGLGYALSEAGDYAAALQSYDVALQHNDRDGGLWSNRGTALSNLGRHEEARASYTRAIALNPASAEAFNGRGITLANTGDHVGAIADYDQALRLDLTYAEAHMNRGVSLLQLGRMPEGWAEYEWRWRHPRLVLDARRFLQQQWTGEQTLAGKTILLHNEQGLGDALQFCRYIPMVVAEGARVILEVQRSLAPLFADMDGVAQVVVRGETLPSFDLHCPLLSLPLAFATDLASIPAPGTHIRPDAAKAAAWAEKLGPKTHRRVGLTWSGNPAQSNDRNRSVALADFVTALPQGFDYISLQKDLRDTDRAALESLGIRHFGDELLDFTDTAALCTLMDEVVTVCTSTAHLAGALGKPARVLLCFNPCWRWLLARSDSPWYPYATLYRQSRPGVWADVFARVKADMGG